MFSGVVVGELLPCKSMPLLLLVLCLYMCKQSKYHEGNISLQCFLIQRQLNPVMPPVELSTAWRIGECRSVMSS